MKNTLAVFVTAAAALVAGCKQNPTPLEATRSAMASELEAALSKGDKGEFSVRPIRRSNDVTQTETVVPYRITQGKAQTAVVFFRGKFVVLFDDHKVFDGDSLQSSNGAIDENEHFKVCNSPTAAAKDILSGEFEKEARAFNKERNGLPEQQSQDKK